MGGYDSDIENPSGRFPAARDAEHGKGNISRSSLRPLLAGQFGLFSLFILMTVAALHFLPSSVCLFLFPRSSLCC